MICNDTVHALCISCMLLDNEFKQNICIENIYKNRNFKQYLELLEHTNALLFV